MTHFKSCTSKMNTVWAGLDNVYGNRVLSHKITWLQFRNRFSQKSYTTAFQPLDHFLWKGINQAYKLI